PPGPVPIPLLGNILSIDTKEPWLTYTEWRAVYGDLVFARILDQNVLVINSQHVARALLDKRSAIYSDRPYIATLEPCVLLIFTYSINLMFRQMWLRRCRRLFHQTFRPNSAFKFRPMQIRRAREMIVNLIEDPQHYHSHFATSFSSSIVMATVYDYQPSARDDPLVHIVENALISALEVMTPGRAALLNTFPFLLKLPDRCWGSSIKRDARTSANRMKEMTDMPFRYTQQHMADGSSLGHLEKQDEASKPMFETDLKKAATTALIGTTSTLMAFALTMVSCPDIQRCAQAEIDSVIGRDRLPTFEDRTSLPYVESILRETLRWCPFGPLGSIPHATSSDDVYDGYFIPKGLVTLTSHYRAISRDEKRYSDASRFMPERFLDVNGALTDDDSAGYVFGSGRRACPGWYTADASLWSAIATMLATVKFSFAKDDEGKLIDFIPQFTTGLSRYFASSCHSTFLSLIVSSF
ncbi:cytochrome P450, partial [Suillus decipiens]